MMPSEPVEGVIYGRLLTFLPPMRASQFSEKTAIDDRPKLMPSSLDYPAYLGPPLENIKNVEKLEIKGFFLTCLNSNLNSNSSNL